MPFDLFHVGHHPNGLFLSFVILFLSAHLLFNLSSYEYSVMSLDVCWYLIAAVFFFILGRMNALKVL